MDSGRERRERRRVGRKEDERWRERGEKKEEGKWREKRGSKMKVEEVARMH